MKEIYLAAGCFWGAERYFKNLEGVLETQAGFANGSEDAGDEPTYEEVYTDETGYAETVRIVFDETKLPLTELLEDYFCIIDPTSVNRQGEDEGTRYRTGIYFLTTEDRAVAVAVMEKEQKKHDAPITVEVEPLRHFFPASEYHQDYLEKNPDGYCHLPLKVFRYPKLISDLKSLLGDETDRTARLANAAALIKERMGFFWVGFYLEGPSVLKQDQDKEGQESRCLILGPFQGPVACMRIGYGKGVCGAAWKEGRTIIVPDVVEFPGHIACSSLSKSEIVVPMSCGVLDIDSREKGTFDRADAHWLEKIAGIL